ncbi:MAG: ABC transporter [Legionella sp.]|jgi:hypothetical protein
MNSKEDLNKLLTKCIEINEAINKKIPLAANRHAQFEQIERTKITDFIQAKIDEARASGQEPQEACFYEMEFLDEHDKQYEEFESNERLKRTENSIFQEINSLFADFLRHNAINSPKNVTYKQQQVFKQQVLKHANKLCDQISRSNRLLNKPQIDIQQISNYLQTNIDSLIQHLCAGSQLSINNEEWSARFKIYDKLVEYRSTFDQQSIREQHYTLIDFLDPKMLETYERAEIFERAAFYDKPEIDVGFCGEFTALALKRLFDQFLIREHTTLEKITISYVDDNGNPNDNHTFLAINRDPESPLNDINQWKGILLDPWNKIACLTDDFATLPNYYISYPSGAEWSSIKFTSDDYEIKRNLTDSAIYFSITENSNLEQRIPRLMEEYQLTTLNTKKFAATKKFLSGLVAKSIPENLRDSIELLITSRGNKLVHTVAGFAAPKIAVHCDFIKNLDNGIYTVAELEFALTNAVYYIRHQGVSIYENIPAEEQFKLDKLSIEQCHNVPAAISFLRKNIDFTKKHQEDNDSISLPKTNLRIPSASDEQRIKTLMTYLAINENERAEKASELVPDAVASEVASISPCFFYQEDCDKRPKISNKLAFLSSKLEELWDELLPYEHMNQLSIRARDFCKMLYGMKIDFQDPEQLNAVHHLINRAFKLRIPAFERIYWAINQQAFKEESYIHAYHILRPLGPFARMAKFQQDFILAKTYKKAQTAALKFEKLHSTLATQFCFSDAEAHMSAYQKKNNKLPTGRERYFGSYLGYQIKWSTFQPLENENTVPWTRYLQWAEKDLTNSIAALIWECGVCSDTALWATMPSNQLYARAFKLKSPLGQLPECYKQFSDHYNFDEILSFIVQQTPLEVGMFDKEQSFEEQFIQFYDQNWFLLMHPDGFRNRNANTEAVRFLLNQLSRVAQTGTDEEKQVVKGFFQGRTDGRDLTHLQRGKSGAMPSSHLNYSDLYSQFIIKQRFMDRVFDLFTFHEQIKLLSSACITTHQIPAEDYIGMARLAEQSLTLECVEKLLALFNSCEKAPYSVDGHILKRHTQLYPYRLQSRDLLKFIQLICKLKSNPAARKELFNTFVWDIPEDVRTVDHISADDLAYIYRFFDELLAFPSKEVQEQFSRLVLAKLKLVEDRDERIKVATRLLSVDNQVQLALSDINVRNQVIKLLIADLIAKYGKDDSTPTYAKTLIAVIDTLYARIPGRDSALFFSLFANAIQSQWAVSEHLGILLEPDKFLKRDTKKMQDSAISNLAAVSRVLSECEEDTNAFLEFISSPLTNEQVDVFTNYLIKHQKMEKLAHSLNYSSALLREEQQQNVGNMLARIIYAQFWDLKLEQRAVIIDHILVPATETVSEQKMKTAGENAFIYVSKKLFPNTATDEDEEFALSVLKAYLDTADKYQRPVLLAGMLVASNEVSQANEKISAGKKLALLCNHMGPAYVKLAQAIHSHPNTPEKLRKDLDHVKGRANPPYRWQLWRLLHEVVSPSHKKDIKFIGSLLGSASYNLALEAQLQDGKQVVLLLLREDAEKDAEKGFKHLEATVGTCQHPKMQAMREGVLSIIQEAKDSSLIERDKDLSEQQIKIAKDKYNQKVTVSVDGNAREFTMKAASLIKNGQGYRFIDRMYGIEFNDLPRETASDKATVKAIAKAVLKTELSIILSGGCFDSDRHGNQLRIDKDTLGLYDFGEMSLEEPGSVELKQLANVLVWLPKAALDNLFLSNNFDALLSEHIKQAEIANESPRYLIRIRKASLALRDFQKELSTQELIEVLTSVNQSGGVHQELQNSFYLCLKTLGIMESMYNTSQNAFHTVYNKSKSALYTLSLFRNRLDSLFTSSDSSNSNQNQSNP